ncbi:MAG: hypothetical protein JSR47_10840 [Proteobacteria bacterium]|nr:hypothetical protein [Pseudomonadota bacterium]MBS0546476.1 hypothetical protein [Pseudomonadota bacterium]
MKPLVLGVAALALWGGSALAQQVAQGVAPGGPIGNSTGIGSGLGNVPGGTGPSFPNGTTAPTLAPAPPPGGTPLQTILPPSSNANTTRPSAYPQPRTPFDGASSTAPPTLGVPLAFPARTGGDISFAKGCWRSSAYASSGHTGTVTWCLDDKGTGRFLYARTDQANFFCHARAQATYTNGHLRLQHQVASCTDNTTEAAADLDCRPGAAEAAECTADGTTVRLFRVR